MSNEENKRDGSVIGDLLEDGLELVGDLVTGAGHVGSSVAEVAGDVLSGAGDLAGGAVEVAGEIIGGAGELIGGILGALCD